MKVLQLIDSLDTGGAEVLAVNIANLLAKENIESHICVTRKEGLLKEKISKNVNYLFLNRNSTLDFRAFLALKNYIKKNKINIIHAHATSSFFAFCVKFIYPKVKVVWHDHYGNSNFLDKRKTFPLIFFSNYFNAIISVNQDLSNWAKKNLKSNKTLVLNNFAELIESEKKTVLKGIEDKRIIHIAGFRPQKDHLTLLKAFKKVISNNPDWTLHLIGKVYTDAYSLSIKNYIDKNSLQNAVFIYGAKSDIKNILSQSTIGVLSSKSEGLPVSLLEYGLAKLPVLVTNVGDCSKVVLNNEALVKSESVNLFSEKLNTIINNKILQKEISNNLHQKVKKEFSKEKFISELFIVYKEIC